MVIKVYLESDPKKPVEVLVKTVEEGKSLINRKHPGAVFGPEVPGPGVRIIPAYKNREAMNEDNPRRIAAIKIRTVDN